MLPKLFPREFKVNRDTSVEEAKTPETSGAMIWRNGKRKLEKRLKVDTLSCKSIDEQSVNHNLTTLGEEVMTKQKERPRGPEKSPSFY